MSSKKEKKRGNKFRMDFKVDKFEPVLDNENETVFRVTMRPDPRVWELIEENGKEAWRNKIDKIIIPIEEFEKAVETMSEIPIVVSQIKVDGIEKYISKSKKRVEEDTSKRK